MISGEPIEIAGGKNRISYEIFMKSKRNRLHCRGEKGIIVTVRVYLNGYAGSHLRERKEQMKDEE